MSAKCQYRAVRCGRLHPQDAVVLKQKQKQDDGRTESQAQKIQASQRAALLEEG